jgi:hypothetical protein
MVLKPCLHEEVHYSTQTWFSAEEGRKIGKEVNYTRNLLSFVEK